MVLKSLSSPVKRADITEIIMGDLFALSNTPRGIEHDINLLGESSTSIRTTIMVDSGSNVVQIFSSVLASDFLEAVGGPGFHQESIGT